MIAIENLYHPQNRWLTRQFWLTCPMKSPRHLIFQNFNCLSRNSVIGYWITLACLITSEFEMAFFFASLYSRTNFVMTSWVTIMADIINESYLGEYIYFSIWDSKHPGFFFLSFFPRRGHTINSINHFSGLIYLSLALTSKYYTYIQYLFIYSPNLYITHLPVSVTLGYL